MANLQFYSYPGFGDIAKNDYHFSQSVRVGDRIECSGQGGWDPNTPNGAINISTDINEEVDQTFENVQRNLVHAGGKGWSQVFRVNTYHIDIGESHARVVENYRKWMPNHQPIWTEIGVKQLGAPGMRIEIEVVAYDPQGAAEAAKKA